MGSLFFVAGLEMKLSQFPQKNVIVWVITWYENVIVWVITWYGYRTQVVKEVCLTNWGPLGLAYVLIVV